MGIENTSARGVTTRILRLTVPENNHFPDLRSGIFTVLSKLSANRLFPENKIDKDPSGRLTPTHREKSALITVADKAADEETQRRMIRS
jgi:hypothetical protein